jgi:hypothetical protein
MDQFPLLEKGSSIKERRRPQYGMITDYARKYRLFASLSGGEPSPLGRFQVTGGNKKPIRRSCGLEIEVQGSYNTLDWLVTLPDGEWWRAANLGDAAAKLDPLCTRAIGHELRQTSAFNN